jgi:hypothetical protein
MKVTYAPATGSPLKVTLPVTLYAGIFGFDSVPQPEKTNAATPARMAAWKADPREQELEAEIV